MMAQTHGELLEQVISTQPGFDIGWEPKREVCAGTDR